MYLKALALDAADLACSASVRALAAVRVDQAQDDPLMDLAAELLIARADLTADDLADLAARVRKAQALRRWRGLNP
ncbi:MAG: hypothetical protein SFV19_08480 [Rhodospirillaceae bacterium]|nr:hypothetical protein [Rhodospirillaceae bacterium]